MDLNQLRHKIALLDGQLVALLNERASCSQDIGTQKRLLAEHTKQGKKSAEDNIQVYVPGQEKVVFERVTQLNHGPLSDDAIRAIYREVMSASISLQKDVSVAFMGSRGSFTHQVALQRFGDSVAYVARGTIADVLSAVDRGQTTYGVVPFENSTFGAVLQALDCFKTTEVKIHAEAYMKIQQSLLSNYQLSAIKRVYSHSQAFGQCQAWLKQHLSMAEFVDVSSTSRAAELAAVEVNTAAICSPMCSSLYGLNIIADDIQDRQDNTTRFFVVSQASGGATGNDKTLVRFTVDHRQPGALCDALRCFKDNHINLTSINSRPSLQRPWHYYFFVECQGHQNDSGLATTLKAITEFCLDVHVLGSFPDQRTPGR